MRHQLSMLEWQALAAIFTPVSRRSPRFQARLPLAVADHRADESPGRARLECVNSANARPSSLLTGKSLDVLPYPSALSSALEQRVNHALTEDQQALLAQLCGKYFRPSDARERADRLARRQSGNVVSSPAATCSLSR